MMNLIVIDKGTIFLPQKTGLNHSSEVVVRMESKDLINFSNAALYTWLSSEKRKSDPSDQITAICRLLLEEDKKSVINPLLRRKVSLKSLLIRFLFAASRTFRFGTTMRTFNRVSMSAFSVAMYFIRSLPCRRFFPSAKSVSISLLAQSLSDLGNNCGMVSIIQKRQLVGCPFSDIVESLTLLS